MADVIQELPTRDELKARAAAVFNKMLDDAVRAGSKREWNRFTGSIASKNDVVRAATDSLRIINDLCVGVGYKPIWDDPEAKPVDTGKMKE